MFTILLYFVLVHLFLTFELRFATDSEQLIKWSSTKGYLTRLDFTNIY